jgi:hypothetical protein
VDAGNQRQAAGHRQGGFRLVENIEAVRAEAVRRQVEEGLAVGAFMQAAAAVAFVQVRPTAVGGQPVDSARRKYPVRGLPGARTSRRYPPSDDSVDLVLNRKLTEPPSGLKPAATAIASISVDLPVPLSPVTNVTAGSRRSRPTARSAATTGRAYG